MGYDLLIERMVSIAIKAEAWNGRVSHTCLNGAEKFKKFNSSLALKKFIQIFISTFFSAPNER